MSRPDPIEYAERLYAAIRAANFSTLSFLAFGNAVKDGVDLRRMPRIAAEPFMHVVGEMLDLEEQASDEDLLDAETIPSADAPEAPRSGRPALPDIAPTDTGNTDAVSTKSSEGTPRGTGRTGAE